ncbi:uncharacterized protein LOC124112503 isoform X3 [Haliotis rufescens]|uniref:uncharacterized protein LOC124112503 isoform X3 n=1 Tax=Haliotis rufescens TaxID=6454 RepID=UPI00201F3DAD|nr:uncharacterized protein LOC124112503 isoform X3 [Haliotis rufescens]XP_046328612.2 uncharacterized protein LOC124112503 isoform X3 [Haliotis rufescens]
MSQMFRRIVVVSVVTGAVMLALYGVVVKTNTAIVTMSLVSRYLPVHPADVTATTAINGLPQAIQRSSPGQLLSYAQLSTPHHLVTTMHPSSVRMAGPEASGINATSGKMVKVKPSPYIIYRCLKGHLCGGYADRQKGIVAGYVMSIMTGRGFGIEMNKPCELSTFLSPNEVDWIVSPETHKLKSQTLKKLDRSANPLRQKLATADVSKIFTENITYLTLNIEFVRYLKKNNIHRNNLGWIVNASLGEVYARSWRTLFRLKDPLQKDLDKFLSLVPRNYSLICAQIRMGKNPSIPNDSETRNDDKSVKTIWTFLEQYNDTSKYKIFVSTDSENIRKESLRRFPNNSVTLPGVIAHVDKAPQCDGFRKVILDQEALSHCDTLLITNSGLGRIAAFFRQREDNMYCFMKRQLTKCNYTSPEFMPMNW